MVTRNQNTIILYFILLGDSHQILSRSITSSHNIPRKENIETSTTKYFTALNGSTTFIQTCIQVSIQRKGDIRKNLTTQIILVQEGLKVSKHVLFQELSCKINIHLQKSFFKSFIFVCFRMQFCCFKCHFFWKFLFIESCVQVVSAYLSCEIGLLLSGENLPKHLHLEK